MIPRKKKWVVLFGGAGREGCVERMISEGVQVELIILPAVSNAKLDAAISKLRRLPCKFVNIKRAELEHTLLRHVGLSLISIGFPYLISDKILSQFHLALNIHPTLLPKYRGPTSAANILINNESESGSTIHHMTAYMDSGDIVAQNSVPITAFDTVRSLQRKVYASEPQLLMDAFLNIEKGLMARPQDEKNASEFPKKRTPADSQLDPKQSLSELFDKIRACDSESFPAFFMHKGQKVCIKLWRPEKSEIEADEI